MEIIMTCSETLVVLLFPYNISNIISITGTNASAGYYYFFYDWEIEKESCVTNLIPVEAIIIEDYNSTQNIIYVMEEV